MIVIASVFPKLQTVKNLEHSLKTTILEKALAVNMWKRLKYLINLDALLSGFFIVLGEVDMENVSPNVRWDVRRVC